MKWSAALFLAALMLAGSTPECSAQLFGSKKPKVSPQQRVAELLTTLKTAKESSRRADAAEELRSFEAKDFPEIVPSLIDALEHDPATSVRIEAATGLGRLRPISVPAGQALEKASSGDANLRVRMQAKTSLMYYQLSGYHGPNKTETGGVAAGKTTTEEPPLATSANEALWNKNHPSYKGMSPTTPIVNQYRPLPSSPDKQVPVKSAPVQEPQGPTVPVPSGGPGLQPPPSGPGLQSSSALQTAPTWAPTSQPVTQEAAPPVALPTGPSSGPSLGPQLGPPQ